MRGWSERPFRNQPIPVEFCWRSSCFIAAIACLCCCLQRAAGLKPRPNFEGTWNSATTTPIERPSQLKDKPFFTPDEAAEWERQYAERNDEPTPEQLANSKGHRHLQHVLPRMGYARREDAADVDHHRSAGWAHSAADAGRRGDQAAARRRHQNGENPEELGLQDQCLAFLTAGPPLLPYSYNSNYQIVQTDTAILVHAEMIHDARIIHLDGRPHPPPGIRKWNGDSIGRWEGNTLVVDTTNFNDGGGFYGDAGGNFGWDRNLHLIERFSLMDRDTLLYQFEIDNPTAFTRPWKGELTMTRTEDRIYEFACHEANYSLENMLRGYRAGELKK